ncbi:FtsB family cell division protein [Nesterenkonia aerolata]|uniref:Septum formation initiator family protein n=1 Tax=Nesterenkonia aerolata TaxID=3074079 RepID=A0ABU2DQP2_9MICC|nr:septum formation initiator family protein [Nesterenkonia sp. LY-0111]MDR8018822.1 septum formation initiator family protein [Nesterenkonia sp. LY-0111]
MTAPEQGDEARRLRPVADEDQHRGQHRDRRRAARNHSAQQRRLAERDQVSGEIRVPARLSAARDRRQAEQRSRERQSGGHRTVSARTAVPERTVSGRMIVLTLVALVVISFMVPTARTYFQQRGEVAELEAEIAQEQQRQEDLESDIARWDDPEYVRQQARERINLVMPDERRYQIVGDLDDAGTDVPENQEPGEVRTDLPWADALWDSVMRSAAE